MPASQPPMTGHRSVMATSGSPERNSFSDLTNHPSSPPLTQQSLARPSYTDSDYEEASVSSILCSCSPDHTVLGSSDVYFTIGGRSIFDLGVDQYARTLKIECYRRRSHTTLVLFDIKSKWYVGTDSHITEVYPTKEAPPSSPESDPDDPKAIKHIQLFGGRILAIFSGFVSHARKSIKLLKNLIEGDEEPPTVAVMAEMLANKLKELHIRRLCDIVLLDNRRRAVDGDGIAYVEVDYSDINVSIPDITQPIAFGTGKKRALKFLNGRLPANIVEARLLIRGAIQAAYLKDKSTGGNIVLICGSGNNLWEQENLARLGSNPITIKDKKRIKKRQRRIREQLKMVS